MPEDEAQRRAWRDAYLEHVAGAGERPDNAPYRCPCCYKRTLDERGASDICLVCWWEDDGQDDSDADDVRGGPNGGLSLSVARENYLRFGASDPRHAADARSPRPDEL